MCIKKVMWTCPLRFHPADKLWQLIDRNDWENLTTELARQKSKIHSKRLMPIQEAGARLPIFSYAIWNGAPLQVLKLMASTEPSCTMTSDSKGRTPLHIACLRSSATDLLEFILPLCPLSVLQFDRDGNLPLHYAVIRTCDSKNSKCSIIDLEDHMDALVSLLVAEPATLVIPNHDVESPIDLARRLCQRETEIVYKMIRHTSVILDVAREVNSGEMTMPTYSSLHEDEMGHHEMNCSERQAVGERPPRRNACPNILVMALETGRPLSLRLKSIHTQ